MPPVSRDRVKDVSKGYYDCEDIALLKLFS